MVITFFPRVASLKKLFILLKLLISVLLFWALFRHMNIGHAFDIVLERPGLLAVTVFFFLLHSLLSGFRLPMILAIYDATASIMTCVGLWLIGLFTNQAMATFVAGDAVRVWLLRRQGVKLSIAAKAVVFDRLFGLIILLVMCLASIVFLLQMPLPAQLMTGLLGLGAFCLVIVTGFCLSPLMIRLARYLPARIRENKIVLALLDLMSVAETGFRHWPQTLILAVLAFVMHFVNAVILYVIMAGLGVDIGFWPVAMVTFPVILLTLLPLSFAGWGMREGALATGLGLFGVAAPMAVATSLIFGFALLLSSLPGCVLLLRSLWRKNRENISA